ncbi:MAG: DUF6777 domain-containing protein [Mycobacterium sp.]|uniref:DUF6777 domain-containing protein n=1 Tax=Mycobacterium sp. TaxID=1785 RepID=UPI003BAF3CE9
MREAIIAAATRSKRNWLIASVVVLLIAAAGGGVTSCHSKASGGELVLTGATEPGANAFMPPAAVPPPTNTQPPPTLQPQGDGATVETQPVHADRDGLYGGIDNNAGVDRDKMIDFYGAHPAQAGAFVEALNTDNTVYWSGGRPLTVADIPTYLHELTPMALRLDSRITNHGFDGAHPTTVQSVFEAGTAVLVDAHGVPRVRGLSGSPLTAPVALRGAPNLVGAPWPGYRSGALAEVLATTAAITNFVLVDIVTGQPFNRPAGTTGTNDTPHTEPVAAPVPAPATSAPSTTGHTLLDDIDGTYLRHNLSAICAGRDYLYLYHDSTLTITHHGNQLTYGVTTGTVNADGSFSVTEPDGRTTTSGTFVNEGGRTVIHGQQITDECKWDWTGTKQ